MKKLVILMAALLAACGQKPEEQPKFPVNNGEENTSAIDEVKVGAVFPAWQKGYLDIHAINSGRGECTFYILPDGTTLLVDAGEIVAKTTSVPQKPDAGTRPYMVYAKYIKHFLPEGSKYIDYCLMTHFHIDHLGSTAMASKTSPAGYKLSGITALYDEVPFLRMIDRAYPTYAETDIICPIEGDLLGDYVKFVNWLESENKAKVSMFKVGEEQFNLLYDRKSYLDFSIFNICGNGQAVVKNSTTGTQRVLSRTESKAGNFASCGFHLKYGKFDYIACGDLVGAPQNRVAQYCQDYVHGLDVFKSHHHLNSNSWGTTMQTTSFSPRVIVNQAFYSTAPDPALLESIKTGVFEKASYSWEKDIFCTNIHPDQMKKSASTYSDVKAYNGHVVVRVSPGGKEYWVYVLDDTNFSYRVKSIHGPYMSE